MNALLLVFLIIGAVGLLVVAFVAFPYRGRAVPKAPRLTAAVAAVTEKVDPGEASPHGVLSSPEKARQMAQRFEKAERKLKNGAKGLLPVGRGGS